MSAQSFVGLSWRAMRSSPRISTAIALRLGAMKNRFPTDRLTPWRQRFVAIARELDSGVRRRDSMDAVHPVRGPFVPRGSLRGIRLGCVRAA